MRGSGQDAHTALDDDGGKRAERARYRDRGADRHPESNVRGVIIAPDELSIRRMHRKREEGPEKDSDADGGQYPENDQCAQCGHDGESPRFRRRVVRICRLRPRASRVVVRFAASRVVTRFGAGVFKDGFGHGAATIAE